MRKSLFAILVACIMLITCSCGKGTSSDSAGASISLEPLKEKPLSAATESLPADNTSNSVGLMAFYPNADKNMSALVGTNTFTVYFENKGVAVGIGKLGVYDANSNAIYSSVSAEDTSKYEISEMDSIGTALTGWDTGTKIDIYFDKTFEKDHDYYVLIDEGFFELGKVPSGAVSNASLITFSAKPYGVDLSSIDFEKNYSVGDTVQLQVFVDGEEASLFAFSEYDSNFIEPTPDTTTEDSIASIKFTKEGKPSISISFFKDGHRVDSISLTFNVNEETKGNVKS